MKTNEIKKWSIDNISFAELAREVGASRDLVSKVVRGTRVNGPKAKQVIEAFLRRGCPADFFEDDQQAA